MAVSEEYRRKAALLIRIIPLVAEETSFALKGGTAINLFVLDVGCGPGLLLAMLAADYPELRIAGLYIAPEMVRIATERLGSRAEITLGDAESLPWEDASFDHIFCVNSFPPLSSSETGAG